MMVGSCSPFLLFLLLALSFSPSLAEIGFSQIRFSDSQNYDDNFMFGLDQFGFTHTGRLELNVSKISLSNSNSTIDLSTIGFFLCAIRSCRRRLLAQLHKGEIPCALQSHLVKPVFIFDSLNGKDSFHILYNETNADKYDLVFANCYPKQVKVSMDVRFSMYNLDKNGVHDYLFAGRSLIPKIYFLNALVYFALAAIWIAILYRKRFTTFEIHFLMLAIIIFKALNLLCEAEAKSYIKRTGLRAHDWDVLVHISSFLKGISLSSLYVLIGTGWSFLKPFHHDDEKKLFLMISIPLQVIGVIDESGYYGYDWLMWRWMFFLVWPIIGLLLCPLEGPPNKSKNLREAAKTDGKAAYNFMKLTLFRHYYSAVIIYLYVSRNFLLVFRMGFYRHDWIFVVLEELATIAFYVYTGYKFMPEAHNPYFVIYHEGKAPADSPLKLEDKFESYSTEKKEN